jgi:threonine dehydrogenase-like Zn-dependent dehydrogenase
LYPHQTAYTVPRASVVAVPEAVPAERAVLAANMETAINGVWDARLSLGDRVAVIGAGVVGCLVAYLVSSLRGCSVFLIDIDEHKRNVALALGVPFATSTMAIEADVVFEASGAPEGLSTALRLVADEGTVVALSWFGDKLVTLPLGESFHSRRIELVSSQVGRVSRHKRGRWAPHRRLELALSLLDDPRLDVLITGETAFEDLPDTMARLASSHEAVLCQRVRYT